MYRYIYQSKFPPTSCSIFSTHTQASSMDLGPYQLYSSLPKPFSIKLLHFHFKLSPQYPHRDFSSVYLNLLLCTVHYSNLHILAWYSHITLNGEILFRKISASTLIAEHRELEHLPVHPRWNKLPSSKAPILPFSISRSPNFVATFKGR